MQLNPYLNFDGNAEEAFRFYHSVFGGEFYIQKMKDAPGGNELSENEKDLAMHVSISIGKDQYLMASDIVKSMGHKLIQGNGNYISVTTDSREEADRLFDGLSVNGEIEMPMEDAFWGDYFGSFRDQYGVYWMINFPKQS